MIYLTKVLAETDEDGRIRPVSINLGDGADLRIDRVLSSCPMKFRKDQDTDTGMRYLVMIQGKDVVLCRDRQWWIEE